MSAYVYIENIWEFRLRVTEADEPYTILIEDEEIFVVANSYEDAAAAMERYRRTFMGCIDDPDVQVNGWTLSPERDRRLRVHSLRRLRFDAIARGELTGIDAADNSRITLYPAMYKRSMK